MSERLLQIYYDVTAKVLRDSLGNELRVSRIPSITFKENVMVNLQLVTDSDMAKYTGLEASNVFTADLDNAFVGSNVMCRTLNEGFNSADNWGIAQDEQASAVLGQLSFVLNANTTTYQSKIGTDAEEPNVRLQVRADTTADVLVDVFQMEFRALNILGDGGAIPDTTSAVLQVRGNDVVLLYPDGSVAETWVKQ